MNQVFEDWFLIQFGKDKRNLLDTDADGKYSDETINAMFIGFSAGAIWKSSDS